MLPLGTGNANPNLPKQGGYPIPPPQGEEVTVQCDECGAEFQVSERRASPERKRYCKSCYIRAREEGRLPEYTSPPTVKWMDTYPCFPADWYQNDQMDRLVKLLTDAGVPVYEFFGGAMETFFGGGIETYFPTTLPGGSKLGYLIGVGSTLNNEAQFFRIKPVDRAELGITSA